MPFVAVANVPSFQNAPGWVLVEVMLPVESWAFVVIRAGEIIT